MANIINVSTGLKTYDIADMDGKILSSFSFNPADVDIVERYDKAMAEFESKIGNIQSLEAESVGEKYKKMKELAYDMVDGIFNADVASKFFSIMSPFTLMEDGRSFLEVTITAIGKVIENEVGVRVKKADLKISKHTAKYRK